MIIPVPIPIGRRYTAIVSETVLKYVTCEGCQSEYVYKMFRQSAGFGTSVLFADNQGAQDRAKQQAKDGLRERLKKDCDVVPCPSCGRIQTHMFRRAGWEHTRGMFRPIAILFIILLLALTSLLVHKPIQFFFHPNPVVVSIMRGAAWAVAGICVVGVVLLQFRRLFVSRSFDPNAEDPEGRIRRGRARGILRKDFEASLRGKN